MSSFGLRQAFAIQTLPKEVRRYRRTGLLLFLLNLPMGGMILPTVRTNSGFSYSRHILYVSALSAFYAFIQSIRGLLRFRVLMNAPTGGGIWCTMVLPVVFMLLRSRKLIAAQTSSIFQHFR